MGWGWDFSAGRKTAKVMRLCLKIHLSGKRLTIKAESDCRQKSGSQSRHSGGGTLLKRITPGDAFTWEQSRSLPIARLLARNNFRMRRDSGAIREEIRSRIPSGPPPSRAD